MKYRRLMTNPTEGDIVVMVWFDGEPDLYIVDDDEGLQELIKSYTDEWGPDRITHTKLIVS